MLERFLIKRWSVVFLAIGLVFIGGGLILALDEGNTLAIFLNTFFIGFFSGYYLHSKERDKIIKASITHSVETADVIHTLVGRLLSGDKLDDNEKKVYLKMQECHDVFFRIKEKIKADI